MLSAVGFDLFASMLAEAVAQARAEKPEAHADVKIDLPLHFYLPEEYIPGTDERVLFYRRIAGAHLPEDVQRVAGQMLAAYGAPPAPAQNMVDRALAKSLAAEAGITSVTLQRGKLVIEPVHLSVEQRSWIQQRKGTYLVQSHKLMLPIPANTPPLSALIEFLETLGDSGDRR
jgi:transcription-repair coupling factor (superfamily II helicase)